MKALNCSNGRLKNWTKSWSTNQTLQKRHYWWNSERIWWMQLRCKWTTMSSTQETPFRFSQIEMNPSLPYCTPALIRHFLFRLESRTKTKKFSNYEWKIKNLANPDYDEWHSKRRWVWRGITWINRWGHSFSANRISGQKPVGSSETIVSLLVEIASSSCRKGGRATRHPKPKRT